MIPKRIFSIWLTTDPVWPPLVDRCVPTHNQEGYEHKLITLENCYKDSEFVRDAITAKRWAKAADYLRAYYLYTEGGVYVDADMEILSPLDDLLDHQMFVWQESNGIYSNAFIGSVKGHPLLKEYLRRLDENFKGGGDLVFESGVRAFADLIWTGKWNEGLKVIPAEQSYMHHYFLNSWV